jgi:hypothetical protein
MDLCNKCDLKLIKSCQLGDYTTAQSLFEIPKLNPNVKDNLAIVYAIETGIIKLIELFIKDHRIPYITKCNAIEYYSCLFGRISGIDTNIQYLYSLLKGWTSYNTQVLY